MTISEVLNYDEKFRYQLLDRMRCDCLYYLGNGNRQTKYLWAGNEADHIAYMKAIWNSFPAVAKPEWLMLEQIKEFEKQMIPA